MEFNAIKYSRVISPSHASECIAREVSLFLEAVPIQVRVNPKSVACLACKSHASKCFRLSLEKHLLACFEASRSFQII